VHEGDDLVEPEDNEHEAQKNTADQNCDFHAFTFRSIVCFLMRLVGEGFSFSV
jgi:hypothetical protein